MVEFEPQFVKKLLEALEPFFNAHHLESVIFLFEYDKDKIGKSITIYKEDNEYMLLTVKGIKKWSDYSNEL